ncbi:MAG: hypothetical protein ACLU38_02785 [Dysosmobacter sp.]
METQQPIVAFLYDFDKTLCTTDMQDYAFIPSLGMTPAEFWAEANAFGRGNRMDGLLAYMYTMIQECAAQNIKLVTRADLVEKCGESIVAVPRRARTGSGRINAFGDESGRSGGALHHLLRPAGDHRGLRPSARNSRRSMPASSTTTKTATPVLAQAGRSTSPPRPSLSTGSTRAFWTCPDDRNLNDSMPDDCKRVPFTNMIYMGTVFPTCLV